MPAALTRMLAVLAVAAIGASIVGTSATAQSGRGQAPNQPPGQANRNNERLALHVKFKEGTSIRLRGGRLVSLGDDDLSALQVVLARYPGARFERLFSRPEAALDAQRRRAEATRGRGQTADLNLWYRMRLSPGTNVDGVIADLKALSIVESAYRQPRPAPMPVTPDFSGQQGYRDAATDGIDAAYAAAFPGGTGGNVRIIDVEYSWNTSHEDLGGVNVIANGTPTDPFSSNDHGTAVLGELWGRDNGFGVLGLAHAAWMGVVNASDDGDYDLADAIDIAASNLGAGDVMLIEQQTEGANGGCDSSGQTGCVAVEWVEAFYDAIVAATSAGIIVVEAAGNGDQNLDGTEYGDGDPNAFPAGRADSGAIIVGAGAAPGCTSPARDRLSFSSYGSRVNLQGWGECVVTTGYGTLQGVSMGNTAYSNSFGGTSSASPIVTGAAAILSSVAQEQGVVLTPAQVRSQLILTGTAQAGSDHIGPLPNLRGALALFVPTADAGGPYSTSEGTYVGLSAAGSSDPQGSAITYAWDLDDDGQFDDSTSQTPTFTRVGQDGAFVVRVRVTDAHGAFADDEGVVNVTNVAPSVSLAAITTVSENTTTSISGLVTDAGWLDPLTATVDWGDGTSSSATGVLENTEPDATLTYSATHVYGDDGVFTVTVCGRDDDTTSAPCAVRTATVTNTNPTATIDLSSATLINGVPTIIAKEGLPTAFSAGSTDPGSDDLTARWTWADGTADTVTPYLNAPPGVDPDPSPSIHPRNVTDSTSHTFGQACLYTVGFQSSDDDAGSASSTVKVIVGGSATVPIGAGNWQTNYRPRPTALSESRRLCYLLIAGFMSQVFDEVTDASTVPKAFNVLAVNNNSGSATQLLDRQLLAAWLNFAHGAFTLTTMVDTDGVGGADTQFQTVMAQVEAARLNPATAPAVLLAFKDMLERINQ